MFKAVFLIFQVVLFFNCFSQHVPQCKIGLGTGFTYSASKIEQISPYAQTDKATPVQLNSTFNASRGAHCIQLYHVSLNLSSPSGAIITEEAKAYLQYAYHHKIGMLKNDVRLSAGLVLNARVSRRQNTHEGLSIGTNDTGEVIVSLSPSFFVEKPLGKNLMSFQCWTALIAWSVQRGYALSYPVQSNVLLPGKFMEIDARISYNKYLSRRFGARADYQFELYKLSKYDTITSLSHQIVFSLLYNIK